MSAASLARYLLNEASSGQAPTTVIDDTGNGNDLEILYSPELVWTTNAAGNGLGVDVPNGNQIARLVDIATNGNIASSLLNQNKVSLILDLDLIAGHVNGGRLFALGTSGGNSDFAISYRGTNLRVRWQRESGGVNDNVNYTVAPGVYHLSCVIDTAQAVQADRCKLHLNNVLQTAVSNDITQNSVFAHINSTNRTLSLFNRGNLNRAPAIKLFYVELLSGDLTEQQRLDAYNGVTTNNDVNWDGGAAFASLSFNQMEQGDTQQLNLDVLNDLAFFQLETGDIQQFNLINANTINLTIDQLETGDTQQFSLDVLNDLNFNQLETGDAQQLNLDVLNDLAFSQTETGDTQVFNLTATNNSYLEFNQVEEGDALGFGLNVIPVSELGFNQLETGDTQVFNLTVTSDTWLEFNQVETGDIQVFNLDVLNDLTFNQLETGDIQSIFIRTATNEESSPYFRHSRTT